MAQSEKTVIRMGLTADFLIALVFVIGGAEWFDAVGKK